MHEKKFKSKLKFKKDKENQEVELLKSQLARALADYDNLTKRVERERRESVEYSNLKLILKLLPVLDMLYEAQKHLNDSGIGLTIKEFEEVFKSEGLERITIKNGESVFDESLHEAIEVVAGSDKDNIICEEVVSG